MTKLFDGQTVIDSETGLPMTPERMEEVRNMILAEGVTVVVDPEAKDQFESDGLTIDQAQAAIWKSLGGKAN